MLLRRTRNLRKLRFLNQELFVCMTTELNEFNDGVG
jgi:hypothetical protein